MKYNIRLNIKAIIRAEQLLKKPFTLINYTNPDEVMRLLYCAVLANNEAIFTFGEFCYLAENEKLFSSMLKEVEKYNRMLDQFIAQSPKDDPGKTADNPYMKDLAGMLVLAGIDAHYVMHEMELCDIPVFAEALDKKKREDMEAARLWTFLTISPHIDTCKIRSVEDLYPFPWEIERQKKEAENAIREGEEMAKRFFKEGMNIFKN